jgi:nucleoid DNA-binding protein
MNERINLQDLAALLAEKDDITKKDAEAFLREYFDVMNEELIKDGSLKIKELGTFKLLQVEDRESINVTTGERVLIPAHYKVAFTPDKKLAETVNEPFAFFETTEIEGDSALDDLRLLSEEEASEEFEPDVDEEQEQHEEHELQELHEEHELQEEEEGQQDSDVKPATIPAVQSDCHNCHYIKRYHTYREQYYKIRKKLKRLRIIIGILSVLLAVASGYIAYRLYIDGFGPLEKISRIVAPDKPELSKDTLPIVSEKIADSIVPPEQPAKKEMPDTVTSPPIVKALKQMVIAPGQRLATIAQNEYGNKAFWIYIYLENKAIIHNPDVLPVGVKIVLPPAGKYGIDSNDPASVQKAKDAAMKQP